MYTYIIAHITGVIYPERSNKVKIKFTVTLTEENVNDIMTSALEGSGITYWCDEVRVVQAINNKKSPKYASDALTTGNYLMIHDVEEEKWHYLTLKKFLKGLQLYVEQGGTLEATEIDGPAADTIVQLAIFGKPTYS